MIVTSTDTDTVFLRKGVLNIAFVVYTYLVERRLLLHVNYLGTWIKL